MQSSEANRVAGPPTRSISWSPLWSTLYSLLVGIGGLGVLAYRLVSSPENPDWVPILVFVFLSLLIQRSSFHFGTPVVHSLAGISDMAAVLALGPVSGAMVASLSGFTYLEARALNHRQFNRRSLLEIPLFNAGLKALVALLSGALFEMLADPLPLPTGLVSATPGLGAGMIVVVCIVSVFWFTMDHVAWGLYDYLEGGAVGLRVFLRDAIPEALFVELLPLPSSLLIALVYTQMGWTAFVLVAAGILAVAILVQRWADARNGLERRVAELTTVDQVSRAIAQAQLDVDELCHLLYDHAHQIVDATIFSLGLFEGDNYALKLWVQEGEVQARQTFRLTPGAGLVNWLRESGQPIRVGDFESEKEALPAQPVYVSDKPPRSALFVPLIAGDTVVGTLSVQSFRRSAYDEGDLRVLSALANQAAVAIQKAQLYSQERKRAQQLETIGQVMGQVMATMELSELFERVVHLIREGFGYYHVALYTADGENQSVTFQASSSAGGQSLSFEVVWGEGLIGWVAANAEAVVVNDVDNDARYRCVDALEETLSELAAPLILDGELLGVLDIQSDQPEDFGPDDLHMVETLSAQVALAIQEARLYEAERQQAWLSTALLQVAESMSRLSDMDAVLTTIVRLTPLLAGVDRCAILLWEQEIEAFVPVQTYGLSAELREMFEGTRFTSGTMPALDLLLLEEAPILLNSSRDARLIPAAMVELYGIQDMLLLPLLAQGTLQGAMMVDYAGAAHTFDEQTTQMLTGIANQAATVIQSARLMRAQQEEAYVSMALLQVAEVVSRSTDLDEILAAIVRITPMLVGVERCAIVVWVEAAAAFLPVQQYGLDEQTRQEFEQLRLSREEPPMRELVAGESYVVLQAPGSTPTEDRGGSRFAVADDPRPIAQPGMPLQMALPMVTKGGLVGAMFVDLAGPGQYLSQRWLNILVGIASQAAIAVENDRLLGEAAEQERMKQELDFARRIQTSFLPDRAPQVPGWELATIWRPARQVGGDFFDFVPLAPGTSEPGGGSERVGLVIADVADKGVPAALYMALSRTLMRTVAIDGRPPGEALARANDLILADARSHLFVTLLYAIVEPDTGLVRYANAGHMPPLLVRSIDGRLEELQEHGMALGVLSGMEYQELTHQLAPGDTLVLYTDGVTDAWNLEQEMFGRERLVELVSDCQSLSAAALAEAISTAVADFVGDAPQFDDLTLLVAKRVQ